MKFVVQRFYQFEPYGMELVEPSVLTLVYDDGEIAGLDESSLGMYWEDTKTSGGFMGGT